MEPSNITLRTSTGNICTRTAYLRSVVLTAGVDAAKVTIRAGGASGTAILVLGAEAAGKSFGTGELEDVLCVDGIHVTVDSGTTPSVSVVYA